MTKRLRLVVFGDPIPLARSSYPRRGGVYHSPRTLFQFDRIAEAWRRNPIVFSDGQPLRLEAQFFFRSAGQCRRTDLSNLVKLVEDALQRCGALPNDNLIYGLHCGKGISSDLPRTELLVETINFEEGG